MGTYPFSRRTDWPRSRSAYSQALERVQHSGHPLLDLTVSNPTAVGLPHDDALLSRLIDNRSQRYEPESLGLVSAREAVVDYYARRDGGASGLRSEQVCLCAGTSEAYAHLLAVLCDPGDTVLVPRPGYPLLDFVARLRDVTLAPYPIVRDETCAAGWRVDLDALARAAETGRARAVIVVAPSNPTGNGLSRREYRAVAELCSARGLALIADEVFHDYALDDHDDTADLEDSRIGVLERVGCLTFALSGLSKIAALPQLKLSWLAAAGPPDAVREAMHRIELIADTFLSVATPVQHALPTILDPAGPFLPTIQGRIRTRARANLARLRERCRARESAATPLPAAAGWTALLRLPAGELNDLGWALRMLEGDGAAVAVQPGFLYDLPDTPPRVALSLITEPATFAAGVEAALDHVQAVTSP